MSRSGSGVASGADDDGRDGGLRAPEMKTKAERKDGRAGEERGGRYCKSRLLQRGSRDGATRRRPRPAKALSAVPESAEREGAIFSYGFSDQIHSRSRTKGRSGGIFLGKWRITKGRVGEGRREKVC